MIQLQEFFPELIAITDATEQPIPRPKDKCKNDYKIFKMKHPVLSEELMRFYDLGYLGVEKDFLGQTSVLPYKRKKGKQLAEYQKEWNRLQSKIRIRVEHAICRIKKFRINAETFRNRLCGYDGISDIVCGLVNFKIRWKQELAVIP